jgi:hypothetical protein
MAGLRSAIVDPEQQRIDAQIAYANALRDMGTGGSTGAAASGYHGGQVYMVGNPMQGVINQIGGIALGALGNHQSRQLEALRKKEMSDWVGNMPSSNTTAPDFSEQQIRDIPSPMLTKQVPRLGTRVVPKTWQQQAHDMQQWGKQGLTMGSPEAQQLALHAVESSIDSPEKMQEMEAQNELKKAMMFATYGQKGNLEGIKGDIRAALQEQQGGIRAGHIDQQGQYAGERNAATIESRQGMQLAGFENQATRDDKKAANALILKAAPTGAKAGAGDKVPNAILKARLEGATNHALVQNAINALNDPAAEAATGKKNYLPSKLLDYIQPEEAAVSRRRIMSSLKALTNITLKTRSGASVTESESKRFFDELPDGTEPLPVQKTMLNNALKVLDTMGWAVEDQAGQMGLATQDPTRNTNPNPVRTPPAKPADMSDEEYNQFLTDKGYR